MMSMTDTKNRIIEIAETEFMAHGFQKASLRNIAKKAGLTTGAVYGYYTDKESLFTALVSKPAEELMTKFKGMLTSYEILLDDEKINLADQYAFDGITFFCNYIFQYRNAFYLIAQCSEGTKYRSYIDDLAYLEEQAYDAYFDFLIAKGKIQQKADAMLTHILISSTFYSVFEVVVHEMTREKVNEYAKNLADFYIAGWHKILGF